ncbi:MAG TPA: DNA primase [Gemmatales bacterium]|nr:DNA primase [Gemmatales bacterium]HMP59925.1 DNA primase [Gemmatales bacterium]
MADTQLTQRVKEANDIVDVVGEYLTLTKKGRTYKGLCPFHDDHRPSMDVDPTRQYFRCWSCGKHGDVFAFVMEKERCDFRAALELLAQRAHIDLEPGRKTTGPSKTDLYKLAAWAEDCFHRQLFTPEGAPARAYLAERGLTGETLQSYRLGYAPDQWEWLTQKARLAKVNLSLAETLGLLGRRESDGSFYDRFRDRIIFPIRDGRGRTVAFGGRVLPGTATAERGPKYYNSAESALFKKSQHFYGIDKARSAAEKAGYLAVVEGYTDVLMAHQCGVLPVVATLGTALNEHHLAQLRRFVSRVVLVYDADAGGRAGVDRALALFLQNEIDLAIAILPEGQDPCDFLRQSGSDAFQERLNQAVNALDFKIDHLLADAQLGSVEGQRQAMDEILGVLALLPRQAGTALEIKKQLALTRLAQRFHMEENLLWQRLDELRQRTPAARSVQRPRAEEKTSVRPVPMAGGEPAVEPRQATGETALPRANPIPARETRPAELIERQLVSVLVSAPGLVATARAHIDLEEIDHSAIRQVIELLYGLQERGQTVTAEQVRLALADRSALAMAVERAHADGVAHGHQAAWLDDLIARFADRRRQRVRQQLRARLRGLAPDTPEAAALLKELLATTES